MKKLLFILTVALMATTTYAQDASAAFQVDATDKGFLMPRVTTTQRDAIASPATGLQVYNTTTNTINYYNGTAWVAAAAGKFVDGTTATDAVFTTGNVAIGTSTHKNALLHVSDAKGDTYFPAFDANALQIKASGETLNNNILASGNSASFGVRTSVDDVYTGTNATSSALYASLAADRTTALTRILAADIASLNRGNTNLENAWGLNAAIYNLGTGIITNAYSMRVEGFNLGGGTINNYNGIRIEDVSLVGTNNYAIYSLGGDSYHEGNIGIGIETPSGRLQLHTDSPTVSNMFKMTTDGGGGFYSGAADNTANPNWIIGTNTSENIEIKPGGLSNIIFANGSNGRVGLGTGSPTSKLDVQGIIKIGDNSGVTPQAGMIRYNSTTDKFQGYVNDTGSGSAGWVDLH